LTGPRVPRIRYTLTAMAMDVPTLRKLVALDPNDPLSRFALGKKLFETEPSPEALAEAADHLQFANANAPEHLATYHILGQTLIRLGRNDEARRVLEEGVRRTATIGEGMGRDLGPAMRALLDEL
jgi:predicted Zn-dependent protease